MNRQTIVAALIVSLAAFTSTGISQERDGEAKTRVLISSLYEHPWHGPEIVGESPTEWDFGMTEPMTKILKIGKPAQKALLENLGSSRIRAQIIFLLGGVGDETSLEPIIDEMIPASRISSDPTAKLVNRSANLALTNITVADVIWHHGGGVVVERCPRNPKECWQKWWEKNGSTFRVDRISQSRRYSNYPGYGIYKGLG